MECMEYTQFLMGLLGAFIGGILMSLSMLLIYLYDRKKTNQLAQKLSNDVKNVYIERLFNSKTNVKTSGTIN